MEVTSRVEECGKEEEEESRSNLMPFEGANSAEYRMGVGEKKDRSVPDEFDRLMTLSGERHVEWG
jgi:hypothetical protein